MQSLEDINNILMKAYKFAKDKNVDEVLISLKSNDGIPGFVRGKRNDINQNIDIMKIYLINGKVLWKNGVCYA